MKINQKSCPCCNINRLGAHIKYEGNKIISTIICYDCRSSSCSILESKIFSWQDSLESCLIQWEYDLKRFTK